MDVIFMNVLNMTFRRICIENEKRYCIWKIMPRNRRIANILEQPR